jgi:polyhydroxyalkanoate synthesis regulator phasin
MKKQIFVILALFIFLIGKVNALPVPGNETTTNTATTFVLSNEEEGKLIDELIAAGYGKMSLYATLVGLQGTSGGAIPADYMAALAAAPADCEAKTAELSIFSSIYNNPIGIGADGDLIVALIHGRDYYGDAGFSTTTGNIAGVGTVLFTSADSESDYVDAGTLVSGGVTYFYKAIGWMSADAITVAGTATDDTAILQIDNKTPSARDKTWDINVTTGTVKAGVSASDVTLTGLPAGLNYTAAKGTGNNIVITLTGAATTALTGDATITAVIKGSAVTETGARDSEGIALKLWYVGAGTTIVLTNEYAYEGAGYLIDKLVAAGHGNDNLYKVLELLQPYFSGVITERFMKTLASNPAGSEIFTVALSSFAGLNNPVDVNADGTFAIQPIFGCVYYDKPGYTTTKNNMAGVGTVWATAADSPEYYIDAGSSDKIGGRYKAFAIAWSPYVTVSGTATDDTAILQINNKTPSARDKTWDINVTTGTVKAGVSASDVTLTGLPAGLNYTAAKGTGNNIVITLTGAATTALTGDATITAVIKGSAVTETGARDSEGISLKLWYVGAGTTIALSNENGLIDKLIAAGHGNDNLYKVLEFLQPYFSGVITERFMKTLASNPAGSEIFTGVLSYFAGLNNPVGVNTDGTLRISPIFGRDYYGRTGYTTSACDQLGIGIVQFTVADSPEYYIFAGEIIGGGPHYHAFAILWMPADAITVAGTATDDTAILQIDNKTPSARDKTWDINVTTGTVKAGVSASDVTLTGLPAGLNYTAAKGTGNNIVITLTGAATTALTGDATITAVIKGSAVTETGARDSEGIALKLWYVGAGTTIVLTNEAAKLIDQLIAAGHGNDNLYKALELLQPYFSGVITERFMKTLDSTPAGGEVFTVALSNFAGLNNPVCVNADGTLSIQAIFGRDYNGDTGYTTTQSNLTGIGAVSLTTADDAAHLIQAGVMEVSAEGTRYYKAFAILWMPADAITVAGTATDDTAILQIDNKTPSARDKTWDINVTTGTVKAGVSASDVTLTGLPAGLNYTAAKGTGNNIVITLTGAATTALTGDATITAVIKGSAVTETGARDSEGISLKLWYVGAGTTIVLTNEAAKLIDKLIAAGHGNDNLYKALELLQPFFSGVITNRFMKTLDSTPAGSEVFTAALSSFAGVNNPVCINVDGTVRVQPIYGRNYHDKPGYTTTKSNMAGVGTVWATAADSPAYYINAGTATVGDNTITYKAFAVVWMPDLTPVGDLTKNDHIIVYPNPTKGMVWFDLQVNDPIIKVEVYDIKGKQLFCTDHVKENHIDLSGLKNGIYLLKLETHNQKLNQKVIKE